jgi:ribosome maturation factor RimP
VIRVYLDRPGGVSVDDCALFSRRLSDALDMNQIVPGRYNLEVSSPASRGRSGRWSTSRGSRDNESIC